MAVCLFPFSDCSFALYGECVYLSVCDGCALVSGAYTVARGRGQSRICKWWNFTDTEHPAASETASTHIYNKRPAPLRGDSWMAKPFVSVKGRGRKKRNKIRGRVLKWNDAIFFCLRLQTTQTDTREAHTHCSEVKLELKRRKGAYPVAN